MLCKHNHIRPLHVGAARLVRLAALTCVVLVVGSAAVWTKSAGDSTPDHRCIHDDIQQRVLQSVGRHHQDRSTISAAGLPYVEAAYGPVNGHRNAKYMRADSTSPPLTRSSEWGKLRIAVSAEDLVDTTRHCTRVGQEVKIHNGTKVPCTPADILTEEKRDILLKSIIPQAVQLHTDRLKVKQVQSKWRVTRMMSDICHNFKVPPAHRNDGIDNTDFLLYVASVPSERDVRAWATACQVFADEYPAIGVINIPAAQIMSRYDQRMIRAVAHEMAHALGFAASFFNGTGIMKYVENVRNKTDEVPVINSSTAVAKAREHYACDTLAHVEMEDDIEHGTPGSHLKMRNAKDDLMVAAVGAGYYSALTMAIFQDTGFYQADFSKAEVMSWAHEAGCDFLNKKCMENSTTKWPEMFCSRTSGEERCASGRLGVGRCGVRAWSDTLPSPFQYFTNLTLGGYTLLMDYCPYVMPYRNGGCTQNPSTASTILKSFNVFSYAARCVEGAFSLKGNNPAPGLHTAMCADIKCNNITKEYSIWVINSSTYVNCTPGHNITLDRVSGSFESGSYITCPSYVSVCQGNVQGVVDFKEDPHIFKKNSGSGTRGNGAADVHRGRTFLSTGIAMLLLILFTGVHA